MQRQKERKFKVGCRYTERERSADKVNKLNEKEVTSKTTSGDNFPLQEADFTSTQSTVVCRLFCLFVFGLLNLIRQLYVLSH